jgi:hypothetical protein
MSSKIFINNTGNTLFNKLKGIASGMANFDRFLAVVVLLSLIEKSDNYIDSAMA